MPKSKSKLTVPRTLQVWKEDAPLLHQYCEAHQWSESCGLRNLVHDALEAWLKTQSAPEAPAPTEAAEGGA